MSSIETGLPYAVHDGTELRLDLFRGANDGRDPRPCIVLLHGGAMRSGGRADLAPWGRFFAGLGYAAAAIDYRLTPVISPAYPANLHDVVSAVKFLRFRADEFRIDRQRIALLGVSSGAYLAAMAVLLRKDPEVMDAYPSDPQHTESGGVEVAIAVAGTYDNISAWEHDQLHRPDRALEAYLGGTPTTARRTYYHASPMFYADAEHVQGTRWLLAWGIEDDVVDPGSQSVPFARAVKRAGGLVRTCPVAGTGHYWLWHADGEVPDPGLESGHLAARVRTFLRRWSGWDIDDVSNEP